MCLYSAVLSVEMVPRIIPCFSASRVGSLELVQLLLKNGAAPVCQRGSGLSPIHFACDAGHLPVVQLLLMVRKHILVSSFTTQP